MVVDKFRKWVIRQDLFYSLMRKDFMEFRREEFRIWDKKLSKLLTCFPDGLIRHSDKEYIGIRSRTFPFQFL